MKKPIIGITCRTNSKEGNYVSREYVDGVAEAGGIPLLIPLIEAKKTIEEIAERIDGLLLSGGKDVDPHWYGKEPIEVRGIDPRKDFLEINLIKFVMKQNIPILGICRGLQILNIANGGTLNQHIRGLKHYQKAPSHYPTHEIEIHPNTLLFKILDVKKVRVNSFHHQAIQDVAPKFKVSAKASDGVIEAIEHIEHNFLLGVQFHIEHLWQKNSLFKKVFIEFVKRCQKQ